MKSDKSKNNSISVIIPTFNREDVLEKTIDAYLQQKGVDNLYELIIVNDGSTDTTQKILEKVRQQYSSIIKVFTQQNKGPAAARNAALQHIKNDIVLFTGDDMVPTVQFLKEHLIAHQKFYNLNVAVLGTIKWSPDHEVTNFMRWIEQSGWQFRYDDNLTHEQVLLWDMFYTSNISLKKEFLLGRDLFDEKFVHAAYEDTDLSYRLHENGLNIRYWEPALLYHIHPTSFQRFAKRTEIAGYYRAFFYEKHNMTVIPRSFLHAFCKLIIGYVLKLLPFPPFEVFSWRLILGWYEYNGVRRYYAK